MRAAFAPLLALILAATGCAKHSVTAPQRGSSDSLGVVLVVDGNVIGESDLPWSKATNEIVFLSADLNLLALEADTKHHRIVSADPLATGMRCSRDGAYVYWIGLALDSSGTNVAFSLIRDALATNQQTTLARDVSIYAVSPGDSVLAYLESGSGAAGDSLVITRPARASRTTLGSGFPLAFSPDGRELLCRSQNAVQFLNYWRLDAATGESTAVAVPLPIDARMPVVDWNARGISVAYARDNVRELTVYNASIATTELIFATTDTLLDGELAWSRDGTKLAFMTHQIKSDGSANGWTKTTALWIADLTTGRVGRLFVASDYGTGSIFVPGAAHLTFSPDDAWVAYVMRDGLRKIPAQVP